ncbi:MAG: hypothetical protein H7Z17_21115 [Fuerstia sp.]|nr:hypothetical protein [Fuerstiella sp.]
MKKPGRSAILALLVGLSAVVATPAAAEEADSLFSSVRASTAFANEITPDGGNSVAVGTKRLTSTDELVHTLQEASFEASASGVRMASTRKQLDSWIFPVLVTLSEDEQDVSVVLGLRAVSDSQKVPATRLLQLLESNEKSGRTSFAFNRDRSRIELFSLIKNAGVNAHALRDEINRLAILARDTESLWNLEETAGGAALTQTTTANAGATKVAAAPATAAPVTPPAPVATAPSANTPQPASPPVASPQTAATSLHGRWSASRSATEAFAILLNADSTFVLVSVSNGKQARSTGKFTLENSQLTLETSDGSRLLAKVTLVNASEFRFEQQQTKSVNVTPLTFRKAQ